jgi:radical SAM superfamily enzyme YgiQ (UPF0313 family)
MEANKTELNNDGVEAGIETFAVRDFAHGQTVDEAEILGHVGGLFNGKTIKKVLLVNPPDIDETLFDYNTAKRGRANNYPTYGLGILARNLMQRGFEPRICNLNHELLKQVARSQSEEEFDFRRTWTDILFAAIGDFQPDLIGVTCIFSVTGPSLVEVCRACKECVPEWLVPGAKVPVAIGGVHVTHDVENIMNDIPEADLAFLNEAEKAFVRFIDFANGDETIDGIGQVIVRMPSGIEGIRFEKQFIPDADDLDVIPPYDVMDISNHSEYGTIGSWYGFRYEDTQIATVQSNRGCRAACTFCNVRTFHGKGVRQRSVQSVLDELTMLNEKHGIGHIIWLDDDLLKNEQRAIELFNGMVQRGLGMTWDATNGVIAASLKDEVVAAAAASGCIGLNIGIESGNPQILRSIRKPGTPETFLQAAEVLQRYPQINTRALLMLGFPNETLRMIFDTIKLSENMNLDWHNLAILQPWKDTPIYDAMVDQGLLGEKEGTLKSDDDDEVSPYQLGPYSRQRAIEQGKLQQSHFGEKTGEPQGLLEAFNFYELDRVPSTSELDDIWFYMNFRLNFSRLLRETREIKLKQQLTWLRYVATKTAPDNAIILYFYAFLQHRVRGDIEGELIEQLKGRLEDSPYWQERFALFGLSFEHVRDRVFPITFDCGQIPDSLSEVDANLFRIPSEAIAV